MLQISPEKAKAELCRRSLFRFVQEFWAEIIPEDPIWNWHIKLLCDELQMDILRVCRLPESEQEGFKLPAKPREPKLHDLLVNVPPGSSKSTIITIMAPAWAWTVDPTLRVITASYSGDLSLDHAVKSRDIIQSDKYRRYFPEVQIRPDQNNKANYKNTFNGERYATSVGGTIMGIHAHLIIIDDPLNPKQSASESELISASNFVETTLSTRKVEKSVTLTVMVMQRLNELDPAGVWLHKRDHEGKKVKHICLPAEYNEQTKVRIQPPELADRYVEGLLDPVRMDREVLAASLIELGSYGYAGQMGQNPTPEGGGIWQRWFIPVPDKDFPRVKDLEDYGTDWDTAYTEKTTNASSAYVVSGKKDNKMYIDDIGWFNKEFPELINTMKLLPDPHFVEAKACFMAGTLVRTDTGLKKIEEIVSGEFVLTYNDKTKKSELKEVIHRLVFDSFQYLCIFELVNGETIKCTTNHEFYFERGWHSAGNLARRIMENSVEYQRKLLNIKSREGINKELEKQKSCPDNGAGQRHERVFTNSTCDKRKSQNAKITSFSSPSFYSERRKQTGGQPQKFYTQRQQSRKFRMGNEVRKPTALGSTGYECGLQKRAHTYKQTYWKQNRYSGIERTKSPGNKGQVQTVCLYPQNAGSRIRGKLSHNSRLYTPGMEAREIKLADIKSVSFAEGFERVYDLQVLDNHNYCVTSLNVIAHNSGKSAKQTLVTAGIAAFEVQVEGDKLARARGSSPKAEAGLVFCRASILEKLYNDPDQGILKFPNGAKQDLADTLAQAIHRHLGKKPRIASFGWSGNRRRSA